MARYQLVSAYVNLAGDRNNSVFRGHDNPVTYPELLVLAAIHGGEEHVHTRVSIGETEDRMPEAELDRLRRKYGRIVSDVFPLVGGKPAMPEGDPNLPTEAEVEAATAAANEARAKVRASAKKKSAPKADAETAPADAPALSLDALPE